MTNRELLMDAIGDVDMSFIAEHTDNKVTTPVKRFLRFAVPAAVYAAACLAVILLVPFITGKSGIEPPPSKDPAPVVTETLSTDNSIESERVLVTESADTETSETDTTPSETELVPETTTVQTEPADPVAPSETTSPTIPEPKPDTKPTMPKEMKLVSDSTIPYYIMSYDSDLDFDTGWENSLRPESHYKSYKDFRAFIQKCRGMDLDKDIYPAKAYKGILDSWDSFNEKFFDEYDMYFVYYNAPSGSISYYITDMSMGDEGVLIADFEYIEPDVQTCDLQESTYLIAVNKQYSKNASRIVSRTAYYRHTYNYYTGEPETVLARDLPERIDTYKLSSLPLALVDDVFGAPVVLRNKADFSKFQKAVTKGCGGDILNVFNTDFERRMTSLEKGYSFLSFGYVCVGVYDYDYIIKNGKVKVELDSNGVMSIYVPVPENKDKVNKDNMHLWMLQFTNNVMADVKEVKVIESASTNVTSFATCPKCHNTQAASNIFVESIHADYKQTGRVIMRVKNFVTRDIFKLGADTTDEVMKRYLSGIEIDEMSSTNYTDNPGLVEDIISGKRSHYITVKFTLTDKSAANLTKVLSSFGCTYCSEFESGGAVY